MQAWQWALICSAAVTAAVMVAVAAKAYLDWRIEARIAAYQNDLVKRHSEEVRNIYDEIRGWRHDYHNHIQTMKAYRSLNENEKLDGYLDRLDADLNSVDTLIMSGNVVVDAILNSKLSLALSRKVSINAWAAVPGDIAVSDVDLCVIIGNLLDNAIEAALALADESERFIRVYTDLKRDMLYISVTNSSGLAAVKRGGRYLSSKAGHHGFGLKRVDRLVDKYGGYIKRRDEDGAFTTEIMLPVRKREEASLPGNSQFSKI